MNAKDLMIGDWVIHNTYPERVRRIGKYGVMLLKDDYIGINDIEPIPLTAEILEKNGFEHKTDMYWHDIYVLKYRREQTLILSDDPYGVYYWILETSAVSALDFRYVHELQHLMRMLQIDKEVEL